MSCLKHSNNITRDGAKQLAILLKSNTPLEVLNLSYNRIEDDGAVALAEALAAYNTNLTSLLICSNNIASEGLCAVAKAMRSNGSLHALYIWGNKLEEPACKVHYILRHVQCINCRIKFEYWEELLHTCSVLYSFHVNRPIFHSNLYICCCITCTSRQ